MIPSELVEIRAKNPTPSVPKAETFADVAKQQGRPTMSSITGQVGALKLDQGQKALVTVAPPRPKNHLFTPDVNHPVRVGWDEMTGLPVLRRSNGILPPSKLQEFRRAQVSLSDRICRQLEGDARHQISTTPGLECSESRKVHNLGRTEGYAKGRGASRGKAGS